MTASDTTRAALAVVHSDTYAGWVFHSSHPTQGRRFLRAREILGDLAGEAGVELIDIESDYLLGVDELAKVHDRAYVEDVVLRGRSGEWSGHRPDLGALAQRMAGGTVLALKALLEGRALTAVHFAGAKHHAMADHSSGFCVFNDLALSTHIALEIGDRRVAILDIDAHHGDGTEAMLQHDDRVMTFSIHDSTIFPGTGFDDVPHLRVFNEPLSCGAGDVELQAGVARFTSAAAEFGLDLIVIAMGADGHVDDPLSSLAYSIEGLETAVRFVRRAFPATPILLGGAGGYQPDTVTPLAWARMALAAAC
jgi:acetoin utilization protein AcuC